jgi:hypothetical protein
MHMLAFCYPVVAISIIYCVWRAYRRVELRRRERVLRDRVTFLLWTMAQRIPPGVPAMEGGIEPSTPAAANRTEAKGTHQSEKGSWQTHSMHSTGSKASTPSSEGSAREWTAARRKGRGSDRPVRKTKRA